MRSTVKRLAVAVALAGALLPGCGDAPADDSSASGDASGLGGSITVTAATSLTDAFEELAESFSVEHPGAEVRLSFAASSSLARQILDGAPADVFASADDASMAPVVAGGIAVGDPVDFASNELAIVTQPGNPEDIGGLADLVGVGVIALCGEQVPCGRYAAEALAHAGVSIKESSVTRGQNVGATLTAVAEGDAVAGIVYRSGALAAGSAVDVVAIPADHNVTATYPVVVLEGSDDTELAQAFVAYLLSDAGRAVLAAHGFGPPP